MTDELVIDDAFGYWLSGFIDGEGWFGIHYSNRHHGREGFRFGFGIQLREDDRPLLEEIVQRVGAGIITTSAAREREWSKTQACAVWRVGSQRDVARIIELLDRYPLRGRRAQLYGVWREAFLTARGNVRRLGEYRDRLAELRLYEPSAFAPVEAVS